MGRILRAWYLFLTLRTRAALPFGCCFCVLRAAVMTAWSLIPKSHVPRALCVRRVRVQENDPITWANESGVTPHMLEKVLGGETTM